jgi:hypothetical protein
VMMAGGKAHNFWSDFKLGVCVEDYDVDET